MTLSRAPALLRSEGESLSLTTARLYTQRYPWAREAQIYVPVESRFLVCPALYQALFYDDSAGTYTEIGPNITDRDSGTTGSVTAMTSADELYLFPATPQRIRGFYVNVDGSNVNANASTMTVNYWNGTAWADTSATDGTASGGATLAQDGEVLWTLPSDEAVHTTGVNGIKGYIYQIVVSATLSADTAIEELILLHQNVNYDYLQPGVSTYNADRSGGFVLLVDAGTATARANWHGSSGA
ncbi:MAG: hypothetical protein Q8R28_18050 [Dehalococcoidia bacterium]|nr:hypothetical protein [Dehalococcoidia bacterium]